MLSVGNNMNSTSQHEIINFENIPPIKTFQDVNNFIQNDDVKKLKNYYYGIIKVIKIIWNSIDASDRVNINLNWNDLNGFFECNICKA